MEILEGIAPLLGSLAASTHVYARWGAMSEATIAEQVFDLVVVAQADWAHQAVAGAVGPVSAREIEAALEPVETARAIELMTNLSAFDLVYSRRLLRDRDHAERAAARVAKLLGRGASWVTNTEAMGNGRAWTPVTRHGIDVVVAGTCAEFFVILLAVGDD
ncbi:hypothetical protein [Streptomyces sp. NBC_01314]|uniref:hypothetical protein n=1 Tax=Streptomyces sp. NBC_01314 TaxID=2903821 RepID=UPI0030917CAF|nr:hypothetical protein OG622_49025 [Streptomyces sp. NBC_01314]